LLRNAVVGAVEGREAEEAVEGREAEEAVEGREAEEAVEGREAEEAVEGTGTRRKDGDAVVCNDAEDHENLTSLC
jgi:hypothetical protein